ncbi:MAG: metallophosphoesterase family protein [Acidobacteriota bacterium]
MSIRIAIIADIHGNVPALEAVLADIAEQRVDEVVVGGDLVGRGPQGSRVVQRIRELDLAAIGGNHEDYLLGIRSGDGPPGWDVEEQWAASRWMSAELTDDDVEYLEALPFSLARPGLRLVHGTPQTNRAGVGPWTGDDELAGHWGEVDESLLVCAHTHRPMIRQVPGGQVVNVGSVGLPFNRDQRAQYAIFSRDTGDAAEADASDWQVELRQVPYDLEAIYAIYESTGFLTEGGITAQLLRLELEYATSVLVPFLEWAKFVGVEASAEQLGAFFEIFDPNESLRAFYERVQALRSGD